MFPITTKGGGTCACFPDVCKTPAPPAPSPVPIPYPNIAQCSSLKGSTGSKKTKIQNKAIVLKKSILGSSSGDEPGTLKGLISNNNRGELKFTRGESSVKVEKSPVVYLTCTTQQNCASGTPQNPAGINVSPGQTKVRLKTVDGARRRVRVKAQTYHDGGRHSSSNANSQKVQDSADNLHKSLKGNRGSQAVSQASEGLGEAGARNGLRGFAQKRGTDVVPGSVQKFSGSGTVDMFAELQNGALVVIEAKGGSGRLCSRVTSQGRALQGTPEYLRSVAENMVKHGDDAQKAAGGKIISALDKGKPPLHYVHARTKYKVAGGRPKRVVARNTEWKEFDP